MAQIQTPPEVALPHFEDRLSEELSRLHGTDRGHQPAASPVGPGPRRRRRGPLLVSVGAAAAGAVLVLALTSTSDTKTTSERDPALSLASVTAEVNAAMEALPSDTILYQEEDVLGGVSFLIEGDGSVWTYVDENGKFTTDNEAEKVRAKVIGHRQTWYDPVTAATRLRVVTLAGEPVYDEGWPEAPGLDDAPAPGLTEPGEPGVNVCDPVSGYEWDEESGVTPCDPEVPRPEVPVHPVRLVDHCRSRWAAGERELIKMGFGYIKLFLETDGLTLDGTEEVDGRTLLRLRTDDGRGVHLVDPETYLPVQATGDEGTTTYEYLPRTEENLQNLATPMPAGYEHIPTMDVFPVDPRNPSNCT